MLAARQQVTQLQSLVKPGESTAVEDEEPAQPSPNKRRKLTSTPDFATIHHNMEHHGAGVLNAPRYVEGPGDWKAPGSQSLKAWPVELPPVQQGEKYLADYHATTHRTLPFVHWPALRNHFDQAYQERSLDRIPSDSRAVLLGVFACGSLSESPASGQPFQDSVWSELGDWPSAPNVELIRAAMLGSVFLAETSRMSAAFIQVGAAVRAAQHLGLHQRSNVRSAVEEERRHHVWWSLFCMERYAGPAVAATTANASTASLPSSSAAPP